MFSVLVIRLSSLRLLRVSGIVMRLRMFLLLITFLKASHSFRNRLLVICKNAYLFATMIIRDGLIRVRNIRALNGRFNTSITHAYSIVIGSKHITLNATGGGFLTASKQFRHGATSKSRSNTASN